MKSDTKDLRKMIELIKRQKVRQRKNVKKFIGKVREALDDLEREL